MKNSLRSFYFKEMFFPSLAGIFFNPFYHSRKELNLNILNLAPQIHGKILDIGCGTLPYKSFFHSVEYIVLEIDTPIKREQGFADYFYNGADLPFEDNSFDSIVSFQVFEHVQDFDKLFCEILRVLKPTGKILFTAPFIWEEHETPYDFRRFTSYGLTELAKNHNLEILNFSKTCSGGKAIIQIINLSMERMIREKLGNNNLSRLLNLLPTAFFNIIGAIFRETESSPLYLDNVILLKQQLSSQI
jgi:SAM-dependent methyltransferase